MTRAELLQSYYLIKQKIDKESAKLEELREKIKSLGDCAAGGYVATVDEQERRSVSLHAIKETSPAAYRLLTKSDLIKTTTVYVVKVKRIDK